MYSPEKREEIRLPFPTNIHALPGTTNHIRTGQQIVLSYKFLGGAQPKEQIRQTFKTRLFAKYSDSSSKSPENLIRTLLAAEGLFVIEDWLNLGPHYDKTRMAWNRNFQEAWPTLKKRYDEKLKRMWEYYLLSCSRAFRAREIQVWQIVMTKSGVCRSQPRHRF